MVEALLQGVYGGVQSSIDLDHLRRQIRRLGNDLSPDEAQLLYQGQGHGLGMKKWKEMRTAVGGGTRRIGRRRAMEWGRTRRDRGGLIVVGGGRRIRRRRRVMKWVRIRRGRGGLAVLRRCRSAVL